MPPFLRAGLTNNDRFDIMITKTPSINLSNHEDQRHPTLLPYSSDDFAYASYAGSPYYPSATNISSLSGASSDLDNALDVDWYYVDMRQASQEKMLHLFCTRYELFDG